MAKNWGRHLYVIHAGNELTKVGRSQHPEKRLQEVSRGIPFVECRLWAVFPDSGWLEPALHRQLGSVYEKCAEWYRAPADEVLALVACQLAELDKV